MTTLDQLKRCPLCKSADIIRCVDGWTCMACHKSFALPGIIAVEKPAETQPTQPAEIELATFLKWIADRFVYVYGENPHIDFVQTCQRFAEELTPPPDHQIQMKIAHDDKLLRIEFGRLTKWFAMPIPQGVQFAFAVLGHCGIKIEQAPAPAEPPPSDPV